MISRKTGAQTAGTQKPKIYGRPEKLLSKDEIFAAVVDRLFRKQQIHMLVGPSASGKSRFALEMLDRIRHGESIFGHASHPTPFIYVTADRDYNTARGLLFELGLNPDDWPIFSLLEDGIFQTKKFAEILTKYILPQFPSDGHRLVFVEAMTMLVGDKPDYNNVKKFLQGLLEIAHKHDITIIGTAHTPKMKKDEGYELSRENILGSVAWGGVCDTIINFEFQKRNNPLNPGRRIVVWPHSYGKTEVHHMAFEDDGRLHYRDMPIEEEQEKSRRAKSDGLFKSFLRDHNEFIADDLYHVFVDHGFDERTAKRSLEKFVESGIILRAKKGVYQKRERTAFDLTDPEDDIAMPAFKRKELDELQGLA